MNCSCDLLSTARLHRRLRTSWIASLTPAHIPIRIRRHPPSIPALSQSGAAAMSNVQHADIGRKMLQAIVENTETKKIKK